ncbi:hypothetical protein ACOBQX_15930 [Actinokineospora sp. G85]|uniref:hypothetical protein n=1 Tax=Actinokineospora sp. G85 TaxID=3406626 RepID=UPI003C707A88
MANGVVEPLQIEEDLSSAVRRKAARTIASVAVDADECAELLAMLGLAPEEGKGFQQESRAA